MIVPTFCQDIIASIISSNLDQKYYQMNEIVKEIYKTRQYYNFDSFFKKIKLRKNIIYTFSKITENIFEEDKDIENIFGKFNKHSISIQIIESIKSESDLIFSLKEFTNYQNKKILIFRFTENDLNKINSVNYLINNFQKEYPSINNKLIFLIVHKQRIIKNLISKKNAFPDLISLINEDYEQVFIDNLQGKETSDIFKLMQKKMKK